MVVEYLESNGSDSDSLIAVLCYQIATISKQKSEALFKHESLDINSEQAWILKKANENPEQGVHQSELVTEEQLIGAKSQVSRLTHDLVEKGYLTRRVDPQDRRQTYLVITPLGLEKILIIHGIIDKRRNTYLHSLTIDEYNTLVILLRKALSSVKQH